MAYNNFSALEKWLGEAVEGKPVTRYELGQEPHIAQPICPSCAMRTSRIVYANATRLLQNDYVIPADSELAHFFFCFVCDSPRVLYLHPAVAGLKVDASPVACDIHPLTQSPAWG